MMVAVAALSLSLVSCGGASSEKSTENADSTKVETPAADSTKVETPAEGDVVAKYEALVNKAIELQAKVAKGDATAVEEYTKISEEMANLSSEFANATPEQAAKIAEIGQKLATAAQTAN